MNKILTDNDLFDSYYDRDEKERDRFKRMLAERDAQRVCANCKNLQLKEWINPFNGRKQSELVCPFCPIARKEIQSCTEWEAKK